MEMNGKGHDSNNQRSSLGRLSATREQDLWNTAKIRPLSCCEWIPLCLATLARFYMIILSRAWSLLSVLENLSYLTLYFPQCITEGDYCAVILPATSRYLLGDAQHHYRACLWDPCPSHKQHFAILMSRVTLKA